MNNLVVPPEKNERAERALSLSGIEAVLIRGDLSKLSQEQRLTYYNAVCESVGLNPLTQPLAYILMSGKEVLYAKKDATDQLRKLYGVSVRITAREKMGDVYVVTARAILPNGREDESTGVVPLGNLKGDMLANAFMKAETKAKRRVTLSICGLGLLDETEVETIPQDKPTIPTSHGTQRLDPLAPPTPQVQLGDNSTTVLNPVDFKSYVIGIHSRNHRGKKLSEVDPFETQANLDFFNKQKVLTKEQIEYVEAAQAYLRWAEQEALGDIKF